MEDGQIMSTRKLVKRARAPRRRGLHISTGIPNSSIWLRFSNPWINASSRRSSDAGVRGAWLMDVAGVMLREFKEL